MITLVDWANAHVPVDGGLTLRDRGSGAPLRPELVDRDTGAPITPHSVTIAKPD